MGYTVLYQHVECILRSDSLLPWAGFYHQGRGKHAALASDLMEPFRHVVERVAIQMFLRKQLTVDDFTLYPNQRCNIHDSARRCFLSALSERFDQEVVALGSSEPQSIHQHIHAQNLALIRWIREGKPFNAWRVR